MQFKRIGYKMRVRCGWICLVVMIYQANACLDLLVRSFNEVFSPIIETGGGRIRKPHQVDDLTNLYQSDEYGNIIPIHEMSPSQSFQPGQRSSDAISNEKYWDFVSDPNVGARTPSPEDPSNQDSNGNDLPTNNVVTSSYNENMPRKRTRSRGAYYIPGQRPIVDFFIKFIESLQLTTTSKFITSRPRYENSRLQYVPNTYNDIY